MSFSLDGIRIPKQPKQQQRVAPANSVAALAVCPFTVVVDTREQLPYSFSGMTGEGGTALVVPTVVHGLSSGDYSIQEMEGEVSCERKSLEDLYGSTTWGRKRFEAEIGRLNEYKSAFVVVEATWWEIVDPLASDRVAQEFANEIIRWAMAKWPEDSSSAEIGTGAEIALFATEWAASKTSHPDWINQTDPKTVAGTIAAWSVRYPNVHWWACGNRRGAECRTFAILRAFWNEQQKPYYDKTVC